MIGRLAKLSLYMSSGCPLRNVSSRYRKNADADIDEHIKQFRITYRTIKGLNYMESE